MDLVIEKGFDAATVQEVAKRAHVGRSTFYAHFEDKDDLFVRHFVGFMRGIAQGFAWDEIHQRPRLPVAAVFEHAGQFRPLYEQMVKARRWEPMMRVGRAVLAESIAKALAGLPCKADVPAALRAEHIASTLTTLMSWWFAHHQPHTAREMDEYFHRLLT